MKKTILTALFIAALLPWSTAQADDETKSFQFKTNFCEFQTAFPANTLTQLDCPEGRDCDNSRQYKGLFGDLTRLDVMITCTPLPKDADIKSDAYMSHLVEQPFREYKVTSTEMKLETVDKFRNARLSGVVDGETVDAVYASSVWVGKNTLMRAQGVYFGPHTPEGDETFFSIFDNIEPKITPKAP